ncbi:MAG: hypothetical protein D6773_12015, partial [Alphaproteobacteria bacterium]
MTDALERLKSALRDERAAPPREATKKAAIAQALAAFDSHLAQAGKGNALADRLKGTASAAMQTLVGRRPMRMNPALTGGVSLSVLLIAALGASYVQNSVPRPDISAPLPVQTPGQGAGGPKRAADGSPEAKAQRSPVPQGATPLRRETASMREQEKRRAVQRTRAQERQRMAHQQRLAPPPAAALLPQAAPA